MNLNPFNLFAIPDTAAAPVADPDELALFDSSDESDEPCSLFDFMQQPDYPTDNPDDLQPSQVREAMIGLFDGLSDEDWDDMGTASD